jgi:1,4-dihydroxy-2-naphthoyl-CoA hydrolase
VRPLLSLDDGNGGSVGSGPDDVNMSDKPEITEVVNAQMPLGTTLGIRMFGDAEEVDATIAWAPELCTAGGVLHGGVLMSLADAAGGVCAFLNLPAGSRTATIESKTNFLGAVREGAVLARARPLHIGSTTIVVETDVFDANERRVARTIQTQAVLAGD